MIPYSYSIFFFIFYLCIFCPFTISWTISTSNFTIKVVDKNGRGDYWKIQDAIDAVPPNNNKPWLILINPGVYIEKVTVPKNKPFITLSGIKPGTTLITWSDHGDIFKSPTLTVLASDFVGRFLTIRNDYGPGDKAVALRVSGDKVTFFGCVILSFQDTLLDDIGRHYYKNCFIEGDTDFIFGNAASVFESCHLHSISEIGGAITAQKRKSNKEETGFFFVGCKITGKSAILGRAWGDYSRVVFAQTYMSGVILRQGWDDWGHFSRQRTAYFGEYKNYGYGARRSWRVKWSRSLSAKEAAPYLSLEIIGGRDWIEIANARFEEVSVTISMFLRFNPFLMFF